MDGSIPVEHAIALVPGQSYLLVLDERYISMATAKDLLDGLDLLGIKVVALYTDNVHDAIRIIPEEALQ